MGGVGQTRFRLFYRGFLIRGACGGLPTFVLDSGFVCGRLVFGIVFFGEACGFNLGAGVSAGQHVVCNCCFDGVGVFSQGRARGNASYVSTL